MALPISKCQPTAGLLNSSTKRAARSEEHTSELQSQSNLVCRLLLEKKKKNNDHEAAHLRRLRTQGAAELPRRLDFLYVALHAQQFVVGTAACRLAASLEPQGRTHPA